MARLSVALLGPVQVCLDGAPLNTFESDKGLALLAYLAVESERPQRRSALAGLLWPDSPEANARRSLRQSLYSLRQAIGDAQATPPFLLISRDTVQFNTTSDHRLDLSDFNARLNAVARHTHAQPDGCAECAQSLAEAVALYRGEFLQQFYLADSDRFEEWALVQREALHRRALAALVQLANDGERAADYDQARRWTLRQLELEPWREESHRQLMRVLAAGGQRSEALAQYEACRRVLADELGVQPSAETQALCERIRASNWPAPVRPRESVATPSAQPASPPSAPLTSFVGRDDELAELSRLLSDPQCRLVSIVGLGGIGKTRLALAIAAQEREHFAHGVVFAPLVSVHSTALLAPTLANALGFSYYGGDPAEHLLRNLRDKQMLVVLDNFEHLLEGASLLSAIVAQAPGVKLLVTSREPLDLQQEWVLPLEGLSLPADPEGKDIDCSGAAMLFVQRARQARVGFTLKPEDRAAVARICHLSGGMPLGIELAATWVRALSCDEIAQEIARSLDFLKGGARTFPERHQSLRAVFDSSWQLLTPDERLRLARLTVFRGGFEREAAQQVTGMSLAHLSAFVSRSLLRRIGGSRYDMHDLLRQYVLERAADVNLRVELLRTRQAHAHYCAELAETAEPHLVGAEQVTWLSRLDQEHDNLRAAMDWALEASSADEAVEAERIGLGLRLAGALWFFWYVRGFQSEGLEWLQRLLSRPRACPDRRAYARALHAAGALHWTQGSSAAALPLLEEALALSRAIGDPTQIAVALRTQGLVAAGQGAYDAARSYLEQSLAIRRQLGVSDDVGPLLSHLGDVALHQRDYARAQALFAEGASVLRTLGDKNQLAYALRRLGHVLLRQGDCARAFALFGESLSLNLEVKHRQGVAACLSEMAAEAITRGEFVRAVKLFGAASAQLEAVGTHLLPAERADHQENLAIAGSRLSPEIYRAVWAQGRALSMEQAGALALEPAVN